jgi:anaerobic selenocysteine-containing dehydrogenase
VTGLDGTTRETQSDLTLTVRSFCRVCTSICGILVDVEGDQVRRVRGDPSHPLSHGYTCAKGRALPRMHHHPDRLEHPMMKSKRSGALVPSTWDACLDDLARRLRRIIDRHGPAAVGIFFGSGVGMDAAGYRAAQVLHSAIGTPARFSPLTIDGTAKVLVSDLVGGFPGLNSRPDYERCRLLMYIGVNPVVSHGHTVAMPDPVTKIRDLRRHAEVWVLDPRRTETARLASDHLAPRPGTDFAILAFLLHDLLDDVDVRACVETRAAGVSQLLNAVAPYSVERASEVTGIARPHLQRLLTAVRKAGRLAIDTGTGVTMSAGANVTQWLAWALMIVTDSMNQPGGVWFHPGFMHQLEGFELPISRSGPFGRGPTTRPGQRSFLGEWPCAVLADEIRAGHIRAVLNLGGGLTTAFPDANSLIPALRELEVLATIEIIANQTTELSTHVLPTKDQLERADVTLWDFLSPEVSAQYTDAVVGAVGDRRSTWWVLAELGRRLGYDMGVFGRAGADDRSLLGAIAAKGRCSFDRLVEAGYVEADHDVPAIWVERHLQRMGGWRIAPDPLVEQLRAFKEPEVMTLIPRRQSRHLNSQLTDLGDRPEIVLHPADAAMVGVSEAQPVIVRSQSGEIVGVVKLDPSILRGAVSVPHGYQDVNVNRLTDRNQIDPLTGMAWYSGLPVSVLPLQPERGHEESDSVAR